MFAIEILALLITAATEALVEPNLRAIGVLFAWTLLALAWFDYRSGRLPDMLTLPLALSGIIVAAVTSGALIDNLLGFVVGLIFPAGIALSYRRLRGRDGLGFGDVKMLAALGAWVGWQGIAFVLFLAASGALLFCALRGRIVSGRAVRFGPFIATAGLVVWVFAAYGVSS